MSVAWAMVLAMLFDLALGEPRRAHPLVAFGRFARACERRLHADRRGAGLLAWSIAVLPCVALATLIALWPTGWSQVVASALLLYLCIGLRSLGEHAVPVAQALHDGELGAARTAVARIVSRDVEPLDASQVAAAATESVLENGNDAVFGALFWFALLGAPGAVLYRLANTLDAMWGYRTPRYGRFGWAAARIDDAMNFIPARLTALTYALLGNAACALRCWRSQAAAWDSPNAGPVMAAGAGALSVRLGGPAPYHGQWEPRPPLGEGASPDAGSIVRALRLVRRGAALWCVVAVVLSCAVQEAMHA